MQTMGAKLVQFKWFHNKKKCTTSFLDGETGVGQTQRQQSKGIRQGRDKNGKRK